MYIFRAEIKEAHVVKILAETLQGCMKEGCFVINQNGIFLTGVDAKIRKLVVLEMPVDGFISFRAPADGIKIGLNLLHFYRLVKTIKKKDELTMFIEEKEPTKLGIKVIQLGGNKPTIGYIGILKLNPIEIEIPNGYNNPIVATNKEFQNLKKLNKISKFIKVTHYDKMIEFFSDKEGVYSNLVSFGKELEEDEKEQKTDKCCQTFDADDINRLVKIGGLSNIIQMSPHKHLPLKFRLVSSLVKLSIYIKSKEQEEEIEHTVDEMEQTGEDLEKMVLEEGDGEEL